VFFTAAKINLIDVQVYREETKELTLYNMTFEVLTAMKISNVVFRVLMPCAFVGALKMGDIPLQCWYQPTNSYGVATQKTSVDNNLLSLPGIFFLKCFSFVDHLTYLLISSTKVFLKEAFQIHCFFLSICHKYKRTEKLSRS
jgi:hypothetical protein